MTDALPVTDDEHRKAVFALVEEFGRFGLRLLALGSTALLFKLGSVGHTKDADLHPFPVEDSLQYLDAVDAVCSSLDARYRIEPDGSSITLHVPIDGRDVPVELIEGREDFVQPEVLADAVATGSPREGVVVPTWEHVVTMKAEAWYDRPGRMKQKFLEDLLELRDRLKQESVILSLAEVHRLVAMRTARKRVAMEVELGRIFVDLLE